MGLIISILVCAVALEAWLRYVDHKNRPLKFDIKAYPYYKYQKGSVGRQPWFLNQSGRKQTPIISISMDGIRGAVNENSGGTVLMLGCSFTEGGGLPTDKTYPGALNILLGQKYSVINAGISGYGIFQIARLLSELIAQKPDIVIVQLLDFRRIPLNTNRISQAKIVLVTMQRLKKFSHVLSYLYKKMLKNADYLSEPYYCHGLGLSDEQAWNENLKYLREISELCNNAKSPLIFFQWPGIKYFSEKLSEFCADSGDYYCDPSDIYSYYKIDELKLHKSDSHPNELANRLVAKSLYHTLLADELIS